MLRQRNGANDPRSSAHNPYHNYIVYHDDSHTMYTASNGAVCKSIYYLLQVSTSSPPSLHSRSSNGNPGLRSKLKPLLLVGP